MINRLFILLKVVWKLGIFNVLSVVLYRQKLSLGCFTDFSIERKLDSGVLFPLKSNPHNFSSDNILCDYSGQADFLLSGQYRFFFGDAFSIEIPPNWNLFYEDSKKIFWAKVSVNNVIGQDVKYAWDLSRFQWMTTFAAAYVSSNNDVYQEAINSWFSDWTKENSPFKGVNWFCAQEVSIRLINLFNTAYLLGFHKNQHSKFFLDVVVAHGKRIYPTIGYAVAQQNNHGISEASALYISGNWLEAFSNDKKLNRLGRKWSRLGRKVLERLVDTLTHSDGGFAMSSFSYHRVVLDTLSIVEFWRETLCLTKFSSIYYKNGYSLLCFLNEVHDRVSGDVPNVGANDGSRSYILTDSDYRDFRPSIVLFSRYFGDESMKEDISIDWFSANLPKGYQIKLPQGSHHFEKSGFVTLRPSDACSWALFRTPVFSFRPSQADALHLDLWWRGRNILMDSGSFSYNCSHDIENYFSGAAGHNIVQFDSRESMPRLSKFLWGEWLKTDVISDTDFSMINNSWKSGYTDYLGAHHERLVSYNLGVWVITDELSGNFSQAILRWHLEDSYWEREGNVFKSEDVTIVIRSADPILSRLSTGWRSLYYSKLAEVPVLEVEVKSNSNTVTIITEVYLNK